MKKEIFACGPASRGEAYPVFNPLNVNESRFSDAERFKDYYMQFNPDGASSVEWLTQEEDYHTYEWGEEVKRAFKANGAKPGHVINCKFGSRGTGYIEEFELVID